MQLPAYLKHRIRRAWEKNETDALRRSRLLAQNGRRAVKVGAFQVVKVLGKSHKHAVYILLICCR